MVTLFLPLLLLAPVMMLIVAVQALASHGPLGWVAAAVFLAAVFLATRWVLRTASRWWASTKAPERTAAPPRARPVTPARPGTVRRPDPSAGSSRVVQSP